MHVKQFQVGGDRNFAYLVADQAQQRAVIIDPSYSPRPVWQYAVSNAYAVQYVFNTHGHSDHTNGNETIKSLSGVSALGFGDTDPGTGIKIEHEARLPLGDLEIRILHTPGHTADSICLYIDDAVFTGDLLFVGKVGGTDFGDQARVEYESLHNILLKLPGQTRIFPGHDYGVTPESSIDQEKRTNPFLLQTDVHAFVQLKKNWLAYKQAHGIA